jgi:hypothetical protein
MNIAKLTCYIAGIAWLCVATVAQAQTLPGLYAPTLADTRWSSQYDCNFDIITLKPDGSVGSKGSSWEIKNGEMTLTLEAGAKTFNLAPTGQFELGTGQSGSRVTALYQCERYGNWPLLPTAWVEGSVWSGFSDCRVTFRFTKEGRVAISNGSKGDWAIVAGLLSFTTGANGKLVEVYRYGSRLIDTESGSAFTKCS